MYYVYIIQSISTGGWYIGSSGDPARRLYEHNRGTTRSTKPFIPYKLIYTEKYSTKDEALKREFLIKKSGRIRKELKTKISGPIV
ncbi:GIY-YIG nuclease family protein [Candidatus Uhrbacteria bacterium]|nr:GIY-YIG nuclease family protein [Candidatus Uhrbacteria bacterium]